MPRNMLDTSVSELRHILHAAPELSGQEASTADTIAGWLKEAGADQVIRHLGGHGVAAIFHGERPGPRILLRAELDALPLVEEAQHAWRSLNTGAAHSCGHDGHMAILLGVAQQLASKRPARGEVILLFQPAEETGDGARRIVDDTGYARIRPDFAYALHNLPGQPLGEISVRKGAFNCASRGMIIRLSGLSSHAAHPEQGRSPAMAMCRLLQGLERLPLRLSQDQGLAMITLIHARLGEVAFGTSPGQAEVMATLRSENDDTMRALTEAAVALAQREAKEDQLGVEFEWRDDFAASVNDADAVAAIQAVAVEQSLPLRSLDKPHRWSEDFGALSSTCKGAMLTLGSGEQCRPLHHPGYDFPDELLSVGVSIFKGLIDYHLEKS